MDWHQNDADPHADPTPKSYICFKKSDFLYFLSQNCHMFQLSRQYFGQQLVPIRIDRIRNGIPSMLIRIHNTKNAGQVTN
jgi:hypothetical protein